MASFSFGVGNARKLLRVPMYVGGRLATLLIPRSRDRWVFGCAWGVGDGAWALWEHARGEGVRAVWLTGSVRDDLQAQARGIPWTRKGSLRGFWVTARAGVIVITHGFGDVNRYAATGGVIVQLWHGIPLKRLGLDAPVTMQVTARRLPALVQRILTWVVTAAYRRAQSRIRVLPAASQLVRGRLESAFGLPSTRVPVTGEPRTDVLFAGDTDGRRARARTAVAEATGALGTARLILYAPTWRDGAPDPAVPTPAEADRLRALLTESDAVLLIRSHPHGAGAYARHAGERIRLLGADLVAQYALADDLSLVPLEPATAAASAGSGPRHLVLNDAQDAVYVLTEFSGEVLHYRRDTAAGTLELVGAASAFDRSKGLGHSEFGADPLAHHYIWGADLHWGTDGAVLWASERTESTLAAVPVAADGTVADAESFTVTEPQPRGFATGLGGRYLVAAGEKSTTVTLYAADGAQLERRQRAETGRGANWVRFVE